MSIGPGYACVDCQTYLRPRKNGVNVLETFEDGKPYAIWLADLWECPDCGKQVILGYGLKAWAHHFEDNFSAMLVHVDLTIVGCPRGLSPKGERPCITE